MNLIQNDRISRLFLWLGVLTWLIYITTHLMGDDVPLAPFLIFHLTGILGRIILRGQSSGSSEPSSEAVKLLNRLSKILLLLGISVWVVYFSLELITSTKRVITPFLVAHLFCVLSSVGIKLYTFLRKR